MASLPFLLSLVSMFIAMPVLVLALYDLWVGCKTHCGGLSQALTCPVNVTQNIRVHSLSDQPLPVQEQPFWLSLKNMKISSWWRVLPCLKDAPLLKLRTQLSSFRLCTQYFPWIWATWLVKYLKSYNSFESANIEALAFSLFVSVVSSPGKPLRCIVYSCLGDHWVSLKVKREAFDKRGKRGRYCSPHKTTLSKLWSFKLWRHSSQWATAFPSLASI